MSDEEHTEGALSPIITGFGVLATVGGLTLAAVLLAGRPKYDRTDLTSIADLKANQRAELTQDPAWVDKEKGIVSIPIARAQELVIGEIQRDPANATQGEALPVTTAGAAGAGAVPGSETAAAGAAGVLAEGTSNPAEAPAEPPSKAGKKKAGKAPKAKAAAPGAPKPGAAVMAPASR
jgi:hypothetical protein